MRINKEVKSKRLKIITQENQLKDVERKLSALEEKWIVSEINKTSFEKWHIEYNEKIIILKKSIEKLNYIVDKVIDILEQKLDLLIDVKHIFNQGTLLQRRELVKVLFDNNLYYRNGLFLITSIIKPFVNQIAQTNLNPLFRLASFGNPL